LPVSAASSGEDDGPNDSGSLDQVRPPPLRAVATGWLKGGASGRRRKPEARRGRVRAKCTVPLPFPVPEARRSGLKNAAAGAPTGAVIRLLEGVRRAPAIPFASCGGQRNGRNQHQPGRNTAREGGSVPMPTPCPSFRRKPDAERGCAQEQALHPDIEPGQHVGTEAEVAGDEGGERLRVAAVVRSRRPTSSPAGRRWRERRAGTSPTEVRVWSRHGRHVFQGGFACQCRIGTGDRC
jgi:hypothetical protein